MESTSVNTTPLDNFDNIDNPSFKAKLDLFEVIRFVSPEPEISDFLVMQLRVTDVAVARDQNHVCAACRRGVFGAHKHFPFMFELVASDPVSFVILSNAQEYADRLQPVRVRLLQMIEIFLAGQTGPLDVL